MCACDARYNICIYIYIDYGELWLCHISINFQYYLEVLVIRDELLDADHINLTFVITFSNIDIFELRRY